MSGFGVKLPDVGEGVAEAELVSWLVAVGDTVTPDSALAEVMTDKVTVEVSSPVTGVVTALHGEPGEILAVGAPFVTVEVDADGARGTPPVRGVGGVAAVPGPDVDGVADVPGPDVVEAQPRRAGSRAAAVAAPAVRTRARTLGIDLGAVRGTGPDGRVTHADLDRSIIDRHDAPTMLGASASHGIRSDESHDEPVRGVRRRIAERLTASWTQIPHITYVEAVDVTELEALRAELNRGRSINGERLTLLAFLTRAIVLALVEHPKMNSRYDGRTQILSTFDAVHVGVATQTDDGLMVPVVHHAELLGLWDIAAEIGRVAAAARDGVITLEELSGSTITITSLASLGGLATTPIINQPEVAVIGVNKIETRPVWRNATWEPRSMMNLSSSFDHRIIDGWDAATFIQRIKTLLEIPALLFVH